jgi:hypothetical protein
MRRPSFTLPGLAALRLAPAGALPDEGGLLPVFPFLDGSFP